MAYTRLLAPSMLVNDAPRERLKIRLRSRVPRCILKHFSDLLGAARKDTAHSA
jgi:hypothetical protein